MSISWMRSGVFNTLIFLMTFPGLMSACCPCTGTSSRLPADEGKVIYKGEIKALTFEGQGFLFLPNGMKYSGPFHNDLPEGVGILTTADGLKFEGMYVKGLRNGEGRLMFPDGSEFKGRWKDDAVDGPGVYVSPEKFMITGELSGRDIPSGILVDYLKHR